MLLQVVKNNLFRKKLKFTLNLQLLSDRCEVAFYPGWLLDLKKLRSLRRSLWVVCMKNPYFAFSFC